MNKPDESGVRIIVKSKTATRIIVGVAGLIIIGALTALGYSVPGIGGIPSTNIGSSINHKVTVIESAVKENETAIEGLEVESVDNQVKHAGLQQRLTDIERSTRSVEVKVDQLKEQSAEQHVLLQVISRKLDD